MVLPRIIFCLCLFWLGLILPVGVATPATVAIERAESGRGSQKFYWKSSRAGDSAQLLTLFCRECAAPGGKKDVPLVSILRDTLGDEDSDNDRLSYIWLLSYSRLAIGQRMLAAIPFFYWRVGEGSTNVSRDIKPLMDLTAPQHPMVSAIGRDILQWTMLDPMTMPVRASSRAYRSNEIDHERLHLEEAIGYLRQAPVGDGGLTQQELNTVIARLDLRTRLLGGFVTARGAARLGEEAALEQERIRSRNWELLRQCAEKTGLVFEPLQLGGTAGEYAMLWFPLNAAPPAPGTALGPLWKLLNIKNPWTDGRLKDWHSAEFTRSVDRDGRLLPVGESGDHSIRLIPLGVYSMSYPKLPLLLLDFRDKLHVRRHELTQRTVNEITGGVIGISHFTNWYYYAGADLYDFVAARHGSAMDRTSRLDCYSQFRVAIALDDQLDPALRKQMQERINELSVNPLEASPERELQASFTRYQRLLAESAPDGALAARIDKTRRVELASFGRSHTAAVAAGFLHYATFGMYTQRAKSTGNNLATLDRERRIKADLEFLKTVTEPGTQPEVAFAPDRIQSSVRELAQLLPQARSADIEQQARTTLWRLRDLTHDAAIQDRCLYALSTIGRSRSAHTGVTALPRQVTLSSSAAEIPK